MKYLQHFISTGVSVFFLFAAVILFFIPASGLSEEYSMTPEGRFRNWGGYTYLYKVGGVWKARAIFVDDDPNFFCGDGLKKSVLKKGVDLVPFSKEDYERYTNRWAAAFFLPEPFKSLNYHRVVLLDGVGNVFFEVNGFPQKTCDGLRLLGQRFSRLENDTSSNDWLYVPYNLYSTITSGAYMGVQCPE